MWPVPCCAAASTSRYYGIDYAALPAPGNIARFRGTAPVGVPFDQLCRLRAGMDTLTHDNQTDSVAVNGMVIEQAQIVDDTIWPSSSARSASPTLWAASGSTSRPGVWARCVSWVTGLPHNPHPLRAVKKAAYGWRQMIFFLSLAGAPDREDFLRRLPETTLTAGTVAHAALRPAVAGLVHTHAGGQANTGAGRRFLGWTSHRHWLLDEVAEPAHTATSPRQPG